MQRTVDELGDRWRLPFPGVEGLEQDASLRGLDESDRALLAARAVAHPWGTYTQPLCLERQGPPAYRQVVIACDDVRGMVAPGVPQIVPLTREPWQYVELDTGHWPMLSAPGELARLFDGLAAGSAK